MLIIYKRKDRKKKTVKTHERLYESGGYKSRKKQLRITLQSTKYLCVLTVS